MPDIKDKRSSVFSVDKTGGRLLQRTRFGDVIGRVSFRTDCWRGIYDLKVNIATAHDAAEYATVKFG